jgi:hypothetical protein
MIIAKGYEGAMTHTLFPTTAEQWQTHQKVKIILSWLAVRFPKDIHT